MASTNLIPSAAEIDVEIKRIAAEAKRLKSGIKAAGLAALAGFTVDADSAKAAIEVKVASAMTTVKALRKLRKLADAFHGPGLPAAAAGEDVPSAADLPTDPDDLPEDVRSEIEEFKAGQAADALAEETPESETPAVESEPAETTETPARKHRRKAS